MLLAYGASEPLYSQKTVYGRPEGTLTLTLCVGERVAVPAARRLTNMKSVNNQLQKAAVVPMAGVEPVPSASNGGAPPVELHRHIGMFFLFFYFFGWPVSKHPGSFSGAPSKILDYLRYYYIYYIIYYIYLR